MTGTAVRAGPGFSAKTATADSVVSTVSAPSTTFHAQMNSALTARVESLPAFRPVLFTKIACPWCAEARAVLDRQAIAYDERSVTTAAVARAEMIRLSGQSKAPVLDWTGEILADCGAAELESFLATRELPGTGRS